MDANLAQLQSCMYQYSRAIYRSIKDQIDPYVDRPTRLEYRRAVLCECEETMTRLAQDPHYFSRPDRALFQDIRRYFPITAQAHVAWVVRQGVSAAVDVHRGTARSRAARRRRVALQGHDPQGQGVPANAAPRPRLLPVAPASRANDVAAARGSSRIGTSDRFAIRSASHCVSEAHFASGEMCPR